MQHILANQKDIGWDFPNISQTTGVSEQSAVHMCDTDLMFLITKQQFKFNASDIKLSGHTAVVLRVWRKDSHPQRPNVSHSGPV